MKIFIAIPTMESVPVQFLGSMLQLKRQDVEVQFGIETGSLVYNARNSLARQAVKSEADYVLWLDSDMVFNPDLLDRMLTVCQENDIDFLTALCFRRKPPYTPCLFERLDVRKDGKGASYTALLSVPDGRFKVEGCGLAGVLMSTDVLISVAAKFNGQMFDPMYGFGEDVAFCWRARQCGYEIWCDSEIEMGHVGQCVVTRGYFEAYNGGISDVGESEACEKDTDNGL